MATSSAKSCFVIAPIGGPETPTRRHSDQVLRHIIRPAVSQLDYNPVRADEIAEPGVITSQIMQRVIEDDLVIADLTGLNPNVLYELAVRHAILKPFVQIITLGETIPFDVSGIRTVFFDLQDPDSVADAKDEIARQVETLERDSSNLQTPISVPLELQRIRQSGGSDTPGFQEILSVISDIAGTATANRSDIQQIRDAVVVGRSAMSAGSRRPFVLNREIINVAVRGNSPYGFLVIVGTLQGREPWLYELGVDAYRQAVAGNFGISREIFQFFMFLAESFPHRSGPGILPEYLGELAGSYERLVDHLRSSLYDSGDLPF